MAPDLRPKKTLGSSAPRGKIRGSTAPSLHSRVRSGHNLHFSPDSNQRKPSGSTVHDKNFGAPGLFGTLSNGETQIGEIKYKALLAETKK